MERKQHRRDDNGHIMRQCDQCKNFEPREVHRNYRDGYDYYNEFRYVEGNTSKNFFYWLFGGPKEQHYPSSHLDDYLGGALGMMKDSFMDVWGGIRGVGRSHSPTLHHDEYALEDHP